MDGEQSADLFLNADLKVEKGELLAIKGHSGFGKSTLLKIMAGLDTEYIGEYSFMGEIIATNSDAAAQWCDRVIEIKDHKIRR